MSKDRRDSDVKAAAPDRAELEEYPPPPGFVLDDVPAQAKAYAAAKGFNWFSPLEDDLRCPGGSPWERVKYMDANGLVQFLAMLGGIERALSAARRETLAEHDEDWPEWVKAVNEWLALIWKHQRPVQSRLKAMTVSNDVARFAA